MWCILELEMVVEKDYVILKIYEVWYFMQIKKGLFELYVNIWFKINEEVSSWLSYVGNDLIKYK